MEYWAGRHKWKTESVNPCCCTHNASSIGWALISILGCKGCDTSFVSVIISSSSALLTEITFCIFVTLKLWQHHTLAFDNWITPSYQRLVTHPPPVCIFHLPAVDNTKMVKKEFYMWFDILKFMICCLCLAVKYMIIINRCGRQLDSPLCFEKEFIITPKMNFDRSILDMDIETSGWSWVYKNAS